MPLRVKSGAAWVGPVADGNLRVKWGGSSWITAAYCRRKQGDVGGGSWLDTGYRGYPNPPSAPWAHAWSYSNCQVAWNYAAAGGAAIAHYEVVITDAAGNWLATENSTDNISPNWGVSQDTRYRFYVRSVAQNGLVSAFQGPLNVGIGHPSTPNYGYVERTRGWQTGNHWSWRGKDDGYFFTIPSNVQITGMHWRNLWTPMGQVSPGTNRNVSWFVYGGDYGTINGTYGVVYNGSNIDHALNNRGNGTNWGLVCRGGGWSESGDTRFMLNCDAIWCSGYEFYNNYEIVSWNPEQGNYYW